ncbi:DUF1735 and LamG domain-containing protein [uncultured Muribaculum sp.]|uniref:DUF1735 and LamG domain-containing protein n=1 Tax=uncultured Muribaculum sp. TaxID=1918613 RepID=UPI0025E641AF|nr:DUF1735 and LamG domain-containing protein [uncultured Muribaculum sp.]
MKKYPLYRCLAPAVALLMIVACDNEDYSEKSPFDNAAYLDVAATKTSETFTFNRKVTDQTKTFSVKLTYPSGAPTTVTLAVDPSLASGYNARNGTDYPVLPASHYSLEKSSVTIPAGRTTSEQVAISFSRLDELEIDATYICPLAIGGADGVEVMGGSRVMYYLVRRSSAITTALNLRNCYVKIPGFVKDSPTGDVVNHLSAVTMECIVRANSFQETISSVMGIEQYFLIRFGDVQFPNSQLQTQTTFGKFPEATQAKTLNAGQWYHVALTWDLAAATIRFYVDGELQSEAAGHGKSDITELNLADRAPRNEFDNSGDFVFYFGRSYGDSHDPSRMFDGDICEARIWSEARTLDQIRQYMYDIPDPQAQPSLRAYWKFDEGAGTVIHDKTGHGNDGQVVAYWTDQNHTAQYPRSEADLWPAGVEVPKLSWE